jgi:hypothetical protein
MSEHYRGASAPSTPSGQTGVVVGIPVKVNIDSGGKPNGIPERR